MNEPSPNEIFSTEPQKAEIVPAPELVDGAQTVVEPPKVIIAPPRDEPKQEKRIAAPLVANDRGLLVGGTLEEQFRLATAYCQSGLMPRGIDTPQKVLVCVQLLRELNLPVMTCIGKVMPLNGTASIHSDLPLALVRRSGFLKSIKEEWLRDDKGELIGARCTVWRKGADEPVVREFTVEQAKTAKLWGKTSRDGKPGPWILYPDRMLQYRSRTWALKDEFGDVLFGVSILEFDHNATVVDGKLCGGDEPPEQSAADRLNEAYLDKGEAKPPEKEVSQETM